MPIEFHDSKFDGVEQEGADLSLRFSAAYIHQCEGKPGVDAGSGWVQELRLPMRGCIWVLWLSQLCLAQSVTVRVVNELTAKPLANQSVLVQFLFDDSSKTSSVLRFVTDAHGETQFSLTEPTPERIDVEISLASRYWHCACWVIADTESIIHSGLLQVPKTEPPVHPFPPANKEPGRVIFIARPYAELEMLLRPPGALQASLPRPPENRPDLRRIIADDVMLRSVTIWQFAGGQLVVVRGSGEVSFQSTGLNAQLRPTCGGTVAPQDVRRLLEAMLQRSFFGMPDKTYLIINGDEQDWRKLKLHSIGIKTPQSSVKRDFAAGEYASKHEELPNDFLAMENAILDLKRQAILHDRPCTVAPPLWSEIKDAPPAR